MKCTSHKFQCSFCGCIYNEFGKLCRHTTNYHEQQPRFFIECVAHSCKCTFRSVDSLRKHVQRHHSEIFKFGSNAFSEIFDNCYTSADHADMNCFPEQENADGFESDESNDHGEPQEGTAFSVADMMGLFDTMFTKFMLRLREVHILTSSVHSDIVAGVRHLVRSLLQSYRDLVRNYLHNNNFAPLDDTWQEIMNVENFFDSMELNGASEYALLRYLKRHDLIVQPIEYVVSSDEASVSTAKDSFHYVLLLAVIKKMMSHKDVFHHVSQQSVAATLKRDSCSDDSHMESITDGELFRSDVFFLNNPSALFIQLYVDEVELCNPIGAKKGRHKVTAVYYIIGNLNSKYRSQERFIHLAILAKHSIIKKHDGDYSSIMKPLLYDPTVLQDTGIKLDVDGPEVILKGKLFSISADNLSAHALAGFQTYFHAGRVCRFCLTDRHDMANTLCEKSCTLRTPELYNYHLDAIAQNEANCSIYGVTRPCVFSQLSGFSVVHAFPPDIMHDLAEGTIPLTVCLILKHLQSRGLISLSALNQAIGKVSISRQANRPCVLSESALKTRGHISGTAAQKMELFLILPQLIGQNGDDVWQTYLHLRDICDIVFAPAIAKESIIELEELASLFISNVVKAFGSESVTPKMHFMLHYPRLILLYGPLKNYWCMRFEAKHQYFKQVAARTRCFRNITKTLSKRHQMRQCFEFLPEEILPMDERAVTKTSSVQVSKLPSELCAVLNEVVSNEVCPTEEIQLTASLFSNNVTYSVGDVFVLKLIEEEAIPVFIHIKYIMSIRTNWILAGRLLVPEAFCKHLHAYKFASDSWVCCRPFELADFTKHDLFASGDEVYVSMRYSCVSKLEAENVLDS